MLTVVVAGGAHAASITSTAPVSSVFMSELRSEDTITLRNRERPDP
jgi:hypothetical protein